MIPGMGRMMVGTPYGGQLFSGAGSYVFTVPAGVTSINALAVGKGGNSNDWYKGGGAALAWSNGLTVAPGEVLEVVIPSGFGYASLLRGETYLIAAESGGNAGGSSHGIGGRSTTSVGSTRIAGQSGGATSGNRGGSSAFPDGNYRTNASDDRGGAGVTLNPAGWAVNWPSGSTGALRLGQIHGGGAAAGSGFNSGGAGGVIITWGPGRAFSSAASY